MPACRVTFTNRTPDFWQAKVVMIGAKFFYKAADGTIIRDWQTSKQVNLAGNQSDFLDSNEPNECVGAGFFAVQVRIPGQEDKIVTKCDGSDADKCSTSYDISITPAAGGSAFNTIDEALNSKDFELTLTSRT